MKANIFEDYDDKHEEHEDARHKTKNKIYDFVGSHELRNKIISHSSNQK